MLRLREEPRVGSRAIEAAEDRLQALELERGEVHAEKQALQERRAALGEELEQDLEARIRASSAELGRMRALLPQVPSAARSELESVLDALEQHLEGSGLGDRRAAFLAGLRKGDTVYLPRFSRRASIVRLDKKKQRASVRLGRQTLEVAYEELSAFESL